MGRLLAALGLVILAGGLTAWLVAAVIGPALFHQHMVQAGLEPGDDAVLHAEEAFSSASAVSLTLALAASMITSLVVSLFLTARIGRSLRAVSAAASRIAGGRYDSRVPETGLGAEFDELASAFNRMAGRLDASETLRRRLLADVAHEIRTPVATMSAYLEGLEDGVEQLTPETVAVLQAQASRLSRLAGDLAAVTRAESPDLSLDLRLVRPNDLLEAAALAVADRARSRGVIVSVEAEAGAAQAFLDPDRLGQVLTNLVDNALRHTPAGGRVTLTGEVTDDVVRLAVQDTGSGITPDHLPHLFERFYRVDTARDRSHGGSGIGLAIARALVEAHGGTLAVHSDGEGTGATFEIRLPVVAGSGR